MIDWPTNLIESIARRRCVLFLGSGISANSKNKEGKRPATWETFLRNILEKESQKLSSQKGIIENYLSQKDFLTACEIIVNAIGEESFGDIVADEFRRPGYNPSDIHKEIYALDSRIIITPNVDKIYEQYAIQESSGTIVVKSYNDPDIAKYLRTTDYLIIRAHGHVDDSKHLIFTHKQYGNARCSYSSFYKMLDALILTHTFIFLGCGINDPDIKLILENSNFIYPNCRPHYFITAENEYGEEIQSILLKNRNLELLSYENSDHNHSSLLPNLQRLNQLVDEARRRIAEKIAW